ncbi:ligase-associated DNA damage response endonuclease PdeM [Brucella pseudogrignonensis]|jgi:DNA ligase-associated metallophosphoesterase|uniref:ligase-associated DNA damage response endonuclease PdeM n=1 Tax=Brucella pseudogrignonensis TaxID=419475 RepID=UPI000CFD5C10|nr:ligase-associated DNA damage response endonuclease PdeM [Brucella pseudogrignonensis]MQP40921.1 ligase-associated DNA damage response endonuclease PdeM [Ochrobactrum sp. MYb237]KAB2688049.1 ligase-associated DNA damage response endonuclease PdeM [Brucella pseudogrignonensis]PQZ40875.1 metallophosphatase [Brucella pseudogrignonensis]PRA40406.1 metallophosphatase [Brucella pseudogrignonensis]PRA68999.1 metallophosphatase [Brucella pseudogrignonensis]
MSTAVWGNGEAYSLAHAELRGVATIYDPCGALFLPDLHMLVVSDLHLEKGSSFARRGQLIPPYDTAATLDMLAAVIARYQPRTVISLGDSFHDAKASERLPSLYAIRLKSLMERRDWFWITGNHDPDRPADLPGDCVEELAIGPLTFRHEPSRIEAKGEVAGHLHPAARIVRRGRSVRRPCFASDGERLIMPAFGAYTGALNVLDRAFRGLFVDASLRAYMLGQGKIYPIAHGALVGG